jgi:hypothetical protein
MSVVMKIQFPQPYSTVSKQRNLEICCPLQKLKYSIVISIVTPSVLVCYTGPLYLLHLRVRHFALPGHFMYCSLQYGSLLYRKSLRAAAYSMAVCYTGPLYVLQLTVGQFALADRFKSCCWNFAVCYTQPPYVLQLRLSVFHTTYYLTSIQQRNRLVKESYSFALRNYRVSDSSVCFVSRFQM